MNTSITAGESYSADDSLRSIENVLASSHRIDFPPIVLFGYGVFVLLILGIEIMTEHLTFGRAPVSPLGWGLTHLGVYGTLAFLLRLSLASAWRPLTAHPLIARAARTQRIIAVSLAVAVTGMFQLGHPELCLPLLFLFSGVLLHLFGQFSRAVLTPLSWLCIVLGAATLFHDPLRSRWELTVLAFGASLLTSGILLKAHQRRRNES